MEDQRPWHRLFGLTWIDFFRELPVTVELEKDLSLKKQLLDVVILHATGLPLNCQLPDGFENLATYNLITFKSHRQTLSSWSLKELVGHSVNLRKQLSPSPDERELLAAEQFRMYAVSVRSPRDLASHIAMELVRTGVYDVQCLDERIRLIVINELPLAQQNAMLHLFSSRLEVLEYGTRHYRVRSSETSSLLYSLFSSYSAEDLDAMPDALEEFTRRTIDEILKKLPVEKRLEGLSAEERLRGLPAEERLRGLPAEERLRGLPAEERLRDLPAEECFKGLNASQREAIRRLLEQDESHGQNG